MHHALQRECTRIVTSWPNIAIKILSCTISPLQTGLAQGREVCSVLTTHCVRACVYKHECMHAKTTRSHARRHTCRYICDQGGWAGAGGSIQKLLDSPHRARSRGHSACLWSNGGHWRLHWHFDGCNDWRDNRFHSNWCCCGCDCWYCGGCYSNRRLHTREPAWFSVDLFHLKGVQSNTSKGEL